MTSPHGRTGRTENQIHSLVVRNRGIQVAGTTTLRIHYMLEVGFIKAGGIDQVLGGACCMDDCVRIPYLDELPYLGSVGNIRSHHVEVNPLRQP